MKTRTLILTTTLFIVVLFLRGTAQDINKEIKRTTEKEVQLKLESSFGSVNIQKGDSKNIISIYYRKDEDKKPTMEMKYKVRGEVGDLNVQLNPEGTDSRDEDGRVHVNGKINFTNDQWFIKLNNELPFDIESELGAGKSNFDFSGISITNLRISAGASSSKISFDEMNKSEMKNLRIETGVSKFSAENLCNANFKKMTFEGGVGAYYLNFGGELNHEADVDIEVGLGSISIVVPKNVGAMVKYKDSWLSNINVGHGFESQRKGVYKTENYNTAEGRLNIYVEASLGTVKIRREY
jgi:predicted membrane protein